MTAVRTYVASEASRQLVSVAAVGDQRRCVRPVRRNIGEYSVSKLLTIIAGAALLGVMAGSGRGVIAVGVIVAVAGAAVVFTWPKVGAIVLIAVVPTLAGLNRGVPVPGLRLSELLIIGVVGLTAVTTRHVPWGRFDLVALAYVVCTIGLGFYDLSGRGVAPSSEDLGKMIGPLEFLLVYRAVRSLARTAADRSVIIKSLFLATVPVSILGLMQFVNVPGTRALAVSFAGETDSLKTSHGFYRATALFAQGHLLDSYLMLVVLIGVAYLFDAKAAPFRKPVVLAIVLLDGAAMGATATITPILGAAVGILVLAYWYRRLARASLAIAVAAVAALTIFGSTVAARVSEENSRSQTNGGTPSTLSFRWHVWTQQYIPAIEQHLATGYGPELPPGSIWESTESAYVTLLLRGGLPLLVLFASAMLMVATRAIRIRDDRRPIARAMLIATIALLMMQIVDNYLLDSGLAQLWWGVTGLLFADVVVDVNQSPTPAARATICSGTV